MKRLTKIVLYVALASAGLQQVHAQNQAQAPAGSTAQCNDGTYTSEARRSQACAQHKGVKTWLGVVAEAVQTQSPAVSATQAAPSTGLPSRTPATPESPVTATSPAPRSLPASASR